MQQQSPFFQQGYGLSAFPRAASGKNTNLQQRQNGRRRRRQINMPLPDQNFQQQPNLPFQQPQIQSPGQIQPYQQQQQQVLPFQQPQMQSPEQIQPYQQQQQQQQILPFQQQQQLNPALNPSYYQLPNYPTSAIFQDGQFYPTMDPSFSIQAQISTGSTGSGMSMTNERKTYQ